MRNNYIIKFGQHEKCPRNWIQMCQTDWNVFFPIWYAKHCNYLSVRRQRFVFIDIGINKIIVDSYAWNVLKKKKIVYLSIMLLVCIEMMSTSPRDAFSYTSLLKFFNVVMKVIMYASDSVNICLSNIRLYFRIKYLYNKVWFIYNIRYNSVVMYKMDYYALQRLMTRILNTI